MPEPQLSNKKGPHGGLSVSPWRKSRNSERFEIGRGLLAVAAGLELVADLLALVRVDMPARSTAEMWTNASLPPWSAG